MLLRQLQKHIHSAYSSYTHLLIIKSNYFHPLRIHTSFLWFIGFNEAQEKLNVTKFMEHFCRGRGCAPSSECTQGFMLYLQREAQMETSVHFSQDSIHCYIILPVITQSCDASTPAVCHRIIQQMNFTTGDPHFWCFQSGAAAAHGHACTQTHTHRALHNRWEHDPDQGQ